MQALEERIANLEEIIQSLQPEIKHCFGNVRSYGFTKMMDAVMVGDYRRLREINDCSVNDQNDAGHTALLLAVANPKKSNIECVKELLAMGADPNIPDNDNMTALFYAIHYKNSIECVKELLSAGADPNVQTKNGYTPLMICFALDLNKQYICALLDHGADPNARTTSGLTALKLAITCNRVISAEILLNHGADPNVRCRGKLLIDDLHTFLEYKFVKLLAQYGAQDPPKFPHMISKIIFHYHKKRTNNTREKLL